MVRRQAGGGGGGVQSRVSPNGHLKCHETAGWGGEGEESKGAESRAGREARAG